MRITDLLDKRSISLDGAPKSKREALDQMVALMAKSGKLADEEEYRRQVYTREEEGTTGIGEGVATPHGKSGAVRAPGLAAMVVRDGVEFDALDGEPVHLIFLIAAPNTEDNVHLDVLSKLSMMLMDEEFTGSLKKASSVEEFLAVIDKADEERQGVDERLSCDDGEEDRNSGNDRKGEGGRNGGNDGNGGNDRNGGNGRNGEHDKNGGNDRDGEHDKNGANGKNGENGRNGGGGDHVRLLAVTSCPTGIAHTYMAAEGLEKAARKNNCRIKVETRGSGGAKNVLTQEEIAAADCIIVAADARVPMERFRGKKVIERPVSDGISKAEELVALALSGDVPVYHGSGESGEVQGRADEAQGKAGGIGHQIYVQLMNGVSHMLPFVVGGGILIAIAFLVDGLAVDVNALSPEEREGFGTITPAAALFKDIGGVAFSFMLPVLAGFIAMAIGDRPALAVGFVGGMMAAGGSSGFLGALVAGFAAGYLTRGLRFLCGRLPRALEKIAPVLIYPVFGILLIGLVMNFLVEPVMGGVNTALFNGLTGMGNSSRIVLGLVLGGMMAIDMGGPFNKAAYVFGTAAIASGNYEVMAAVMIGGMTPPCAIALATLLFRNRFTDEERQSGPTNFIMGLAFITEGAIPYAAADPLRVLPSCIIGSAAAGALSMAFGCTLMAPHGGIFVVPVMGNALAYLAALVAGTVISALLLGVLKKKAVD